MNLKSCSVHLTDEDLRLAEELAVQRNFPKRLADVKDQIVDDARGSLRIDVMGLLAERAVGKVLGAPLIMKAGLQGDSGYDLQLENLTVQVKYTFHQNGHLILIPRQKLRQLLCSDLYVLVTGSESMMKIVGYATREDCFRHGVMKDFGFGHNFCLDQAHLRKSVMLRNRTV